MKIILCLLLLLSGGLLQSPSEARTLYVTEGGSDTAGIPDDVNSPFSLKAAFAAAQNGDEILITEGHYAVTPGFPNDPWPRPDFSELQLKNLTNVTVRGIGEVDIYGEGPGNFMMIEFCSGLLIDNLTLRGNRPNVPDDVAPTFPLFSTIHLRGTNSALTFSGCNFLQFGNHAISQILPPHTSYHVTVTNCYFFEGGDGELAFRGGGLDGAAVSGMGSGWVVVSNKVERCMVGFEVEGSHGTPITDVTIRDNIITNCYGHGVVLFGTGNDYREYQNIKVINNRIDRMISHPDTPFNSIAIWLTAGENMEIRGNIVKDVLLGPAISLVTTFGSVSNVVVADNEISNALIGLNAFQFPPHKLSKVVIENNYMDRARWGIRAAGTDFQIRSNVLRNSGTGGFYGALDISSGSNFEVIDNVIDQTGELADYGISILSSVSNARLAGNRFVSMTTNQIVNESSTTALLTKLDINKGGDLLDVHAFGVPGELYTLQFSEDLKSWTGSRPFTTPKEGYYSFDYEPTSQRYFRLLDDSAE